MKLRSILYYLFIIGGGLALGYWIILSGGNIESNTTLKQVASEGSAWQHFVEGIQTNLAYPAAILLLQIIAIILVARFFGILFRRIGQPSVIGEIVAGIVLGPSLLGNYFPEVSAFLFPVESLANLGVVSQLGLVLFMFVVGMELDLKILKNQAHDAVVISHASIIFPFLLGMSLAYFIFQQTAPPDISFLSYALFIGISMSITAFPVLARIVQERGMTKTRLGSIAITCAAADDITAWCLLAAVIAVVKAGSLASAGYTILFATAYVVLMLRFVRPFLQRIGDLYSSKERLSKPVVGIFFLTLLISAWTTEIIGIHALFGAFMAGVIMPANVSFRNIFIEKVEDVSQVLLLPLFFVFTGLRTQIGLLNEPGLWQICALVIVIAVVGKFIGSAISAKFVGQNWHSSLTIGALMNTRGLMELVALNIGYDLGVLTAEMFAILVLMALITTFMTGPALDLINRFFEPEKEVEEAGIPMKNKYNILISFGNPNTGKVLLRLANMLTKKSINTSTISALHLSPGNDLNQFNTEEYERENFSLLDRESELLDQPYRPIFRGTDDIEEDIAQMANADDYDLLLTGMGQSVYEGTLLGRIFGFTSKMINPERLYGTLTGKENLFVSDFFDDRTKNLIKTVNIPYGILIDKGLPENINRILVPINSLSDSFLLVYIHKLIQNSGVHITLWDLNDTIKTSLELKEAVRSIDHAAPNHIAVQYDMFNSSTELQYFELMLSSLTTWKDLFQKDEEWLRDIPSVLILKA
ncbi:cation:proton antiporter [Sphingobacterium wenxiniae]|uniref:Kef-type K+ transport system, membrane component KefB n=1 Tax=Sphingobacterium wenxiniae TaxID=683125 RepID=A0A1I6SQZ8_9SPHI|nr:cation:proton antiporter [Sphingobacterium wenxiniae]SFS79336.1 Kef-type K+ transport system, membrane component KefB [Sphingobacterium wenxiniae]